MKVTRLSKCQSPAEFRSDFCTMPQRVRENPYRIGMLAAPICERLMTEPYPSPHEFWLCHQEGRPVGRVCANVPATQPGTGYFGLLEFKIESGLEDVPELLLDTACDWLREQGVEQVIGPIAFNTWFPYRFRLPDGDSRRFEWEPGNPPEYVAAVKAAGFEAGEQYNSTAFADLDEAIAKLEPTHKRALEEGFRFEPLQTDALETQIPALYRTSHAAFADNYLFEPISEAIFAQAYVGIADKGGQALSWIVRGPGGEAVGVLYSFIDNCLADGARETAIVLKTMAVVPEQRGRGLSNALMYLALSGSREHGARYAISAMVHSGIQSESYARKGTRLWRHEYGLFKKRLV